MLTFIISLLSMYTLWILFLAVMSLKRAQDSGKLKPAAKVLGYPVLYGGLLVDVLVNLTVYSVILLELPLFNFNAAPMYTSEWTVSQRTKRLYHNGVGFRHSIAVWIADNLLNDFDPSGSHV